MAETSYRCRGSGAFPRRIAYGMFGGKKGTCGHCGGEYALRNGRLPSHDDHTKRDADRVKTWGTKWR